MYYSLTRGRVISWNDSEENKNQYTRTPAVLPVFSLDEDQWVLVAVSRLTEPKWVDMWHRLKVPESEGKRLERMKTMVQNHKTFLEKVGPKSGTGDFITGKGNGLVILLHGPSGVGKTLTAGMTSIQQQFIHICEVYKLIISRMS